jgi:hypothetical protein
VIIFTFLLDALGGFLLIFAVTWAVDNRRQHAERLRIRRIAHSAEWRLHRLGQEALVQMLEAARQATEAQQSGVDR